MLKWRTEALTTSRDPIFLPELLGAIDECPSPQPDKTRLPSPIFSSRSRTINSTLATAA